MRFRGIRGPRAAGGAGLLLQCAEAPEGTFNRIAFAGLEKAMATIEPGCARTLLAIRSPAPQDIGVNDRED